jgi:hypothetical protein
LKREPSILARSLRAVALVIILVVLVSFATVGYTVYADVSNVVNTVGGSAPTSLVAAKTVIQGSAAVFYLNVTLANKGLYPVALSMSCLPPVESGITCNSPSITVPSGQSQTLQFTMTVQNYSQIAAGGLHVDGQVVVALEPFASIAVAVNIGNLTARGGA